MLSDRQWAILLNVAWFGGWAGFTALMILLSIAMQGQGVELAISGNASNWTVIGGI